MLLDGTLALSRCGIVETMINHANSPTPTVSDLWINLPEVEKLMKINDVIERKHLAADLFATRALKNGQVYLRFNQVLTARRRGEVLLGLELELKKSFDEGIVLWCEPIGDRNSLRKLRGIDVSLAGE